MPGYSILMAAFAEKTCVIDAEPAWLKKGFKLKNGDSFRAEYRATARFKMSARFPGIVAPDFIRNTMRFLMVSERARDILGPYLGKDVEYFPFTLLDHKGKTVAGFGTIINLLGKVDCVNRTVTEGQLSHVSPGRYITISKLVLDESKIPGGINLFRISANPHVLIVSERLRQVLDEEKLTGLQYLELGQTLPELEL